MANTALNRSEVLLLTNKSGGSVAQGDVVIIDSTTAASFTTTTTGAYAAGKIGVVIEPNGIANDAIGLVAFSGYVPKVALSGAASLGDLFKTHTVAKQAVRHAAPAVAGDFGEVLGTGTTPAAILWGMPMGAAGAGSIGGSTGAADNAVIRADGVGGATIQNSLATIDDSGSVNIPSGQTYKIDGTAHSHGASGANHAYYTYLAAMLEPLAIEALQRGAFSYAVNSSTTKLVVGSFNTRLGSGGRWEIRSPRLAHPVHLRDATMTGLSSTADGSYSFGVFIDPTLATYADARTTYFDRLNTLMTSSVKYQGAAAASTKYAFLPGPYGTIVTNISNEGFWYIGFSISVPGGGVFNVMGENDTSTYYLHNNNAMYIPIWKGTCNCLQTGAGVAGALGGVSYVILSSSWGLVTDATSYIFRDDFMAATLDTVTNWTKTESTGGNVAINTDFQWCKIIGNNNWGTNGLHSQSSTARSAGKILLVDVYCPTASGGGAGVGWMDAAGVSDSDFIHDVEFGGSHAIHVKEEGNDRGAVGSGWSDGYIYRVRITLGANNAAYAIQGGPEYQPIGGAAWTDITPGTTSSSTTPLYWGATVYGGTYHISDFKIY